MSRRARFLHWFGRRFVRGRAGGWVFGKAGQQQLIEAHADVRAAQRWAAEVRVEPLDVAAFGELCLSKHTIQGRDREWRLLCGRTAGHSGSCCAPFAAGEDGPTLRWWDPPVSTDPPPRCDETHPVAAHLRCRKALGHHGAHQGLQRNGRKVEPIHWGSLSETADG